MKRKNRSIPKTRLRGYRAELCLKQTDLAAAFGVSEGTYRQWENGQPQAWLRLACKGYAFCLTAGLADTIWTGHQLEQARKRMSLTQTELAVSLDLSRATIGRYESGSPPRWMAYAAMALAFDNAPSP